MISPPFSINNALWRSSRLTVRADSRSVPAWRDAVVFALSGAAAALAVHLLDFNLRIPGHAILRSTLPVTLGMALAPRRLSGTMIGASAWGTTALLRMLGAEGIGWGAFTSMLLIGPCLDVALWQTRGGKWLMARCALAGICANLAAFAVRGGGKLAGWDAVSMRAFSDWLSIAPVTYAASGLLAGLTGAILWFRWSAGEDDFDRGAAA